MKRFTIFLSILLSFFGVTASVASAATLWSAGMETGNMTEWYKDGGGGEYNGVDGCTGNYDYNTCSHASDGSDSRATTERAHTGSYSAKLSIPGVGGGVRLNRSLESRTNDELLYTVWYYFPQKYTRNVNSGGWSNVMQWKSYTNVNNVETNEAIWLLGWDNTGSAGAMQFYLEWYLGSLEGPQPGQFGKKSWISPIDIPVGRWFKVETRYKKTSNFTGTVQVWQDGVLIFDKQNVRTNLVNGELAWYTTNYAEFISPSPYVIYVDDLSISTVSGGADTTPPTIPGTPTASNITSSSLTLTWTASTDNKGVTGYRIERCTGSTCTAFAQIGTSATNSYSSTGLSASTVYRYRVRAVDAAGNLSGYSGIRNATTLAATPNTLTINTTRNSNFMLGYSTSYTSLAQSFKLPIAGKITSVKAMLRKIGAPTSPITVAIRSSLTGANLATATIQPSAVSGPWPATLQNIPITTNTLAANTTYYLVLTAPVTGTVNYYRWAGNTLNPYANGTFYLKTAVQSAFDATAQILYTSAVATADSPELAAADTSELAAAETPAPVLLSRQLEKGSEGEDVSRLQEFLASFDHVYPEKLITGYYGSLTASAVSAFQNFHGLPSVGRVGPMTLEKLNELLGR